MWEKVRKKSIHYYADNEKNKGSIWVPQHSLEIERALDILDYIFKEEQKFFSSGLKKNIADDILWTGFQVRMTAYISIICSLDRIIEKNYKIFLDQIKSIKFDEILPKEKITKNNIEKRKNEIESFRFWRNKVFAHTAFAQPEGDNFSTQATSLAYFGGTIKCGYKDGFFEIGGCGICVGGNNPEIFPIVSIMRDHKKIRKHFEEWENIFLDVLLKLRLQGKVEIKKRNPNIAEIFLNN